MAAQKNIRSGYNGAMGDVVNHILRGAGRNNLLTSEQENLYSKQIQLWMQIEQHKEDFQKRRGRLPSDKEICKKFQLTDSSELSAIVNDGIMARKRFVEGNIKLVVSVAKKYLERGLPFEDLIQEGCLGLQRAAEKFDATKGYKFSTYAYWWICQSISRGIINQAKIIRLPVHRVEALNQMKRYVRELSQQNGCRPNSKEIAIYWIRKDFESCKREPTPEEIKKALPVKLELLDALSYSLQTSNPYSLDEPANRGNLRQEEGDSLGSMVQSDNMGPLEYATLTEQEDLIRRLLDCLPIKQAEVIRLRYGLDTGEPMTLSQVGFALNVSRERIRQIQEKAMRRLRIQSKKMAKTEDIVVEI